MGGMPGLHHEHLARQQPELFPGAQEMIPTAHAVVQVGVVKGQPDLTMGNAQDAGLGGPQGQRASAAQLPAARERVCAAE
jgi:hypothetical protein